MNSMIRSFNENYFILVEKWEDIVGTDCSQLHDLSKSLNSVCLYIPIYRLEMMFMFIS